MRGLTVFISDIRNARARELEEKRINVELAKIRSKFKDTRLNGYDRKKYVCKLLYMYILGWNVDFGHFEVVTLLSSTKFSEKQIGYLGITLFLNEHHSLLHLVVNSIRNDLLNTNELFNCLALHCIANVGGTDFGEAFSEEVYRLLVSTSSNNLVKKKAALTLLRIISKSRGMIRRDWYERIVSMMDDTDLGVALCVSNIVSVLVLDNQEASQSAYLKAVYRLRRIVLDREYEASYIYYTIACPWLQVKLLRILLQLPAPDDPTLRDLLCETLQTIITDGENHPKNAQENNAHNSILFEAINLSIHIGMEPGIASHAVKLLGNFISVRETNLRYLGLETMAKLALKTGSIESLKRHQAVVLTSLRDRDVSVRRRALDLLYSLCDQKSAREIVNELMRYLHSSDFSIREEMVLKIAILVEKYAIEHEWYMNVMLQLLATAGAHVSIEVWHRIIQVVSNNEALQEHAARLVLKHITAGACHENLVKVAGFILGEFGHLIANDEGCAPINQFAAVHSKFNTSSPTTRALLLNTYIKFVNVFPEIKSEIERVFHELHSILDTELQQRAWEYSSMLRMSDDRLLQVVCEEMPPFPQKRSALLSRLNEDSASNGSLEEYWRPPLGTDSSSRTLRLGLTKPSPGSREISNSMQNALNLSPTWDVGYYRLLWKNDGLLYEDAQLQIGLRSEYHSNQGRIVIYYGNKSGTRFTSFATKIVNPAVQVVSISAEEPPPTVLEAKSQAQQILDIRCHGCFDLSPQIKITYIAGSLQEVNLQLPIALHKFLEPISGMTQEEFDSRWSQIRHAQAYMVSIPVSIPGNRIDYARLSVIISGYRWGILHETSSSPQDIKGAGILHVDNTKSGVLLRATIDESEKRVDISIIGVSDTATQILGVLISSGHLSHGIP